MNLHISNSNGESEVIFTYVNQIIQNILADSVSKKRKLVDNYK
jgi:hypothetical protein